MRNVRFAYRGIALAAVLSLSATGQQAVSQSTPAVAASPVVSLDLSVEPARELPSPTLAGAAALNDFPQFDQLYRAAADRGQAPAAFADLHRFWTWSLNDSTGAFYGQATYDRLAATYPQYAAYIDDYKLVDARGQVFYPSAETRRFLLTQAVAGVVPRGEPMRTAVVAPKVKASATMSVARRAAAVQATSHPQIAAAAAPPQAAPSAVAEPRPVARVISMPVRTPAEIPEKQDHRLGQALLLTILGLLGVGVVTLMLHTPSEKDPTSHSSAA